ncbi:high affinity sulfate permease [Sistotremastrum niveocremeum HHB9708]|uniref:High affinity sulfate permease n=2 Tax=Sistotremastraceae TaxID=3402574 RepID=A0A164QQ62_9AGAM|nr:high affinity sulfate permease [Sistotremastrum niveocremeum HHB9708]KZT33997.1 sulfate permease [Sistotremastrum suecicum HHB10207 ss-3]
MASAIKRWALKTVQHDENAVPVIGVADVIRAHPPPRPLAFVTAYLLSLFPFLQWIGRYNLTWLTGDVIAGLTVGIVLVPQSMSYAKIATLPPQYGLYSSFVGVFVYCFFATSKDVSIGPVAVMSLETSKIIARIQKNHPGKWEAPQIATTTAFICGFIVLGVGLLRIGRLVELIPAPAVSGFMTGSALNILVGQVPGLLGTSSLFNTRAATYQVIINTLKNLPHCTKDAAFGVMGLWALYTIRWTFAYLSKRYPHRARTFFFVSITRNAFVIVILTLASWLYCRHRVSKKGKYPISILQTVPRGFQHVGPPVIDKNLISALGQDLFVATIILLLEHIAIAKSFGRVNGYKINPNQELIAIGVTNTVGSVFNAYPATGSFSRSALKATSGVRTPAAGWLTGVVVIVALYGLTDAFFWIPNAGLSAIIIHAVGDLIASPDQVYRFWRVSPPEFIIWWAAVLVTVFSSIENGIYTSIIASVVLLIFRLMIPRGKFLGKVDVHSTDEGPARQVFIPLNKPGIINPHVRVEPPAPGVLIYRHEDGLLYPNSSSFNSLLVDHVKATTRRGKDMSNVPLSQRAWNDPGPRRGAEVDTSIDLTQPIIKAIVLDFSVVTHIDTTAVQSLVDTRVEIEKWADGPVEFHFANILSPWIRRSLIAGGFGTGGNGRTLPLEVAPVVPSHHPSSFPTEEEDYEKAIRQESSKLGDLERSRSNNSGSNSELRSRSEPILDTVTPFFHFDLASAVRAAEAAAASANKPV